MPTPNPESRIPNPAPKRFVLVAGEASGDLLGAGLIEALRERHPDAVFAGVGGPRMIAAGLDAWHCADELAVMGLVEVLRHLPGLLALRRDVRLRTLALRPDAFIGIDAPDFNLGLERRLKQAGVRTAHYVSPSIWAWRSKRAATIGASADRVLCLLPFEPGIYARHGVDAVFVGHPLADAFALHPDRRAARAALRLDDPAPLLALLPGSRLGEIRRLGEIFVDAAALLRGSVPGLRVVAPMANDACRATFAAVLATRADGARDWITLVDGRAHEAMIAADAVLLASGTAALEAMLAKRPMVVAYRVAPLTHWIVRRLGMLETNRYSLPNALAGRDLVPELMQDDCTASRLADTLRGQFEHGLDAAAIADYERLHETLRRDANRSAAAAIDALIQAPVANAPSA